MEGVHSFMGYLKRGFGGCGRPAWMFEMEL